MVSSESEQVVARMVLGDPANSMEVVCFDYKLNEDGGWYLVRGYINGPFQPPGKHGDTQQKLEINSRYVSVVVPV